MTINIFNSSNNGEYFLLRFYKASEEDALSTLPVWRTPPDQGLDSRHYLWFIFSYGMRRELMKMAVAVKRKSSPAATCQIGPVAT